MSCWIIFYGCVECSVFDLRHRQQFIDFGGRFLTMVFRQTGNKPQDETISISTGPYPQENYSLSSRKFLVMTLRTAENPNMVRCFHQAFWLRVCGDFEKNWLEIKENTLIINYHNIFRFPFKNIIRRNMWKKATGLESPNSRLCGKHFREECFYVGKNGRKLLLNTAVPTLLLSKTDSKSKSSQVAPNQGHDDKEQNINSQDPDRGNQVRGFAGEFLLIFCSSAKFHKSNQGFLIVWIAGRNHNNLFPTPTEEKMFLKLFTSVHHIHI